MLAYYFVRLVEIRGFSFPHFKKKKEHLHTDCRLSIFNKPKSRGKRFLEFPVS